MPRPVKRKGWIKLWRAMLAHEFWTEPEPFDRRSAWLDLLLRAEHEGPTAGTIRITERQLAARWIWSKKKIRGFFKQLSAKGMIELEGTTRGTTKGTKIRIVNWDTYQALGTTRGTTKGTTLENTPYFLKEEEEDTPNGVCIPVGAPLTSIHDSAILPTTPAQLSLIPEDRPPEPPKRPKSRGRLKREDDPRPRVQLGRYAWMFEEEYRALVAEHGEDETKEAIKAVDQWAKASTVKDFAATVRSWGFTAVLERRAREADAKAKLARAEQTMKRVNKDSDREMSSFEYNLSLKERARRLDEEDERKRRNGEQEH